MRFFSIASAIAAAAVSQASAVTINDPTEYFMRMAQETDV